MNHLPHYHKLPTNMPVYIGRQKYVVEYAAGKDVLHLGCVDTGLFETKQHHGIWLHERIVSVAKSVWGVDIDEIGLEYIRAQGYTNLFLGDIENLQAIPELFQQRFDLILLTEVLEHLNNPGLFLSNIKPLFHPDTEMLVTVPNSTSVANIIENLRGRELVHPDHNYWFSYRTLQALFGKYGFETLCKGVYCQHDYQRSLKNYFWSRAKRLFGYQVAPLKHERSYTSPTVETPVNKPNIKGLLHATLTTILYRTIINWREFFADGLIFVIRLR